MSNNAVHFQFDSENFIARLKFVIGDIPVRRFARNVGISDTLIRNYLSGSVPSIEKAADIANGAGVDFSWLCLGIGEAPNRVIKESLAPSVNESSTEYSLMPFANDDDDIVWIDSFNVFASAGDGFINEHELGNKLPFSHRWLAENGLLGKRLSLIRVTGNSMHPTLSEKETPLIEILPDDAINRLVDDVYVIRLNGQLLIKRIQVYGNEGFLIKSDNAHYDSYKLTRDNWPDDFKVIAKWTGKKF